MTFAAFGITGDLMRLKILPALYGLHARDELPEGMRIVGISRKEWDGAQLRGYIQEVLPHADALFLSRFIFLQGDTEDAQTFSDLANVCGDDDALVYLSLSPVLYKTVFARMQEVAFGSRGGSTRVMIEKPFGTSGMVAEKLYTQLLSVVGEEDIFLVDHYMAKEWVQRLAVLPAPREDISKIHIRFFETIGVERRGILYDQLGALRDVGQNHVLQIAAHILGPAARAEVLEQLPLFSPKDVEAETARTQYQGYREIKGVADHSNTETYFNIHTTLEMEGWQGVELTLEGGKALPNSHKEVELTLRDGSTKILSEFPNKTAEYEMLIAAAMRGDQSLFPSIHEIRAQWRFIDPVVRVWAAGTPELVSYEAGTMPERILEK